MKEQLSRVTAFILLVLVLSVAGAVVPASAASTWSFSVGTDKVKANGTVSLKKNTYRDVNLYKDGAEIREDDATYKVRWYSSDPDIVFVDKKSGKLRADKYGTIVGEAAKAKITAVITNKTNGNMTKKSFWVHVVSRTTQYGSGISKSNAKVGTYVTLGSYEQDGVAENGTEAIEWLVLDVCDGKALLLSRYALDAKPYHKTASAVTWEDAFLRKWLNGTFYKGAFTGKEKGAVLMTCNTNADNAKYGTEGGNDTKDRVFLLSAEEMNLYFPADTLDEAERRYVNPSRATTATAYAKAAGVYCSDSINQWYDENCYYWLRSPGYGENYKADVYYNGYVDTNGYVVHGEEHGVRPAIWVNLVP